MINSNWQIKKAESFRVSAVLAALVFALVAQRIGFFWGAFPIPILLIMFPALFLLLFAAGVLETDGTGIGLFSILLCCECISYALNAETAKPTSFALFVFLSMVFAFYVRVSVEERKSYFTGLKFVFAGFAILGIVQFALQFAFPGPALFTLKSIVPEDILLEKGYNPVNPLEYGSQIFKSTAFVFLEPSYFGMFVARGIATCYSVAFSPLLVAVMLVALIVSYSGTGAATIAFFVISYVLFAKGTGLKLRLTLVALVALIGSIGFVFQEDLGLDRYSKRIFEFESKGSSGYERFLAPTFAISEAFDGASFPNILFGFGPGSVDDFSSVKGVRAVPNPLISVSYQYGLVGGAFYVLLILAAFRRAFESGPLVATLVFQFLLIAPGSNVPQVIFIAYLLTCPIKARREIEPLPTVTNGDAGRLAAVARAVPFARA